MCPTNVNAQMPTHLKFDLKFLCAGCNVSYVGKTTQHFFTRVHKHLASDNASCVFKHLQAFNNALVYVYLIVLMF